MNFQSGHHIGLFGASYQLWHLEWYVWLLVSCAPCSFILKKFVEHVGGRHSWHQFSYQPRLTRLDTDAISGTIYNYKTNWLGRTLAWLHCTRICMCMLVRLLACLRPYTVNFKLENVEHCGGEPEQADTACLLANWNGCQEKASMSSV